MSTRYAVAVHRIKEAERSQEPSEQLSWAGNEMASILREADVVQIDPPIAWAGLATVHKAHHEIVAAFETEQNELMEMEGRAIYSLKQVLVCCCTKFETVVGHLADRYVIDYMIERERMCEFVFVCVCDRERGRGGECVCEFVSVCVCS